MPLNIGRVNDDSGIHNDIGYGEIMTSVAKSLDEVVFLETPFQVGFVRGTDGDISFNFFWRFGGPLVAR